MSFIIKVNGEPIKAPKGFTISFQPITDGERLLDGNMQISGVASKLSLSLNYDSITESDLRVILGKTWDIFVNSKNIKQTVQFPYFGGTTKTINTYFAPTSVELTPEALSQGRWVNFKMEFIEL
jgi:hypothetical protein